MAVKNRLPWSHNDILRLVIGFAPVLWRTALQAEYRVQDYPGTPPPSVYQVTQSTAFQAAECHVQQLSYEAIRQKHKKPLAVDARCLLRAFDVVAV